MVVFPSKFPDARELAADGVYFPLIYIKYYVFGIELSARQSEQMALLIRANLRLINLCASLPYERDRIRCDRSRAKEDLNFDERTSEVL